MQINDQFQLADIAGGSLVEDSNGDKFIRVAGGGAAVDVVRLSDGVKSNLGIGTVFTLLAGPGAVLDRAG